MKFGAKHILCSLLSGVLLLQMLLPLVITGSILFIKSDRPKQGDRGLVHIALTKDQYAQAKLDDAGKEIFLHGYLYDVARTIYSTKAVILLAKKDKPDTHLTHWQKKEQCKRNRSQERLAQLFAFLFFETEKSIGFAETLSKPILRTHNNNYCFLYSGQVFIPPDFQQAFNA